MWKISKGMSYYSEVWTKPIKVLNLERMSFHKYYFARVQKMVYLEQ